MVAVIRIAIVVRAAAVCARGSYLFTRYSKVIPVVYFIMQRSFWPFKGTLYKSRIDVYTVLPSWRPAKELKTAAPF